MYIEYISYAHVERQYFDCKRPWQYIQNSNLIKYEIKVS